MLDTFEFGLEQIHCFILIVLLWRIHLQYSSGTPGKLFSFYLQVLNGPLVSYFGLVFQI